MKRILLLSLTLCISLWANAQATDLVIDCQTPGWLSSMINYSNQQTVRNLKVTGYINADDLSFIGTMASNHNLNGVLDLGEVNIVGSNSGPDNEFGGTQILPQYPFDDIKPTLRKFVCPLSVTSAKSIGSGFKSIDTLDYNCMTPEIVDLTSSNPNINVVILGENIKTLGAYLFKYNRVKQIFFPSSITTIKDFAFEGAIEDYSNLSVFPNLEYLGYRSFVRHGVQTNKETLPDTLRFPKIKEYHISAFDYKENMHIYLGEETQTVYYNPKTAYSNPWAPSLNNVTFHIASIIPPGTSSFPVWNKGLTVYVPKDAVETYKMNSGWEKANILPEPLPMEQISIDKKAISLEVNEEVQLSANVIPENADDTTVLWESDNKQVATVTENGLVYAVSPGITNVIAMSADGLIRDTCFVTVKAHAESISLSSDNITIENIGESKQLTVTILPEDAVDKSVTWKSANEQICIVSTSGLVTATGAGTTLVTVTTVDGGLTATCVVKVTQHVNSISLDKTTLSLKVGETEQLHATVKPDNADDKIVLWSSSDEDKLTVDQNGVINALKAGEAIIFATSVDNPEAKATCKVTVFQPVNSIALSPSSYTLNSIGQSVQLNAIILPEDASNTSVTWKSTNDQVVTVTSDGLVTATGAGSAAIIATTVDGGLTATCSIKVVQHVNSIALDKTNLTIKVGDTEQLHATILPENADDKNITWSSSDETALIVDQNGLIKALKAGEVFVYAVSADNQDAKASCRVNVIQPVTGITISQSSYKFTNIGESVQLTAMVQPEDASNKTINWNSSNMNVCAVSNGLVVATGEGTAVIIATSEDGGFMTYCTVTVDLNTGVDAIQTESSTDTPTYNIMGRRIKTMTKGRLYIRNGKKYIAR